MNHDKKSLRRMLETEARTSEEASPLALRLLSEEDLDWVGGGSHSQALWTSYSMSSINGGGEPSYTQTGGSFTQTGGTSFIQSAGEVTTEQ